MVDYKAMYLKLFGETAKAIEILQKVQQECEELYLSSEDAEIILITSKKRSDFYHFSFFSHAIKY